MFEHREEIIELASSMPVTGLDNRERAGCVLDALKGFRRYHGRKYREDKSAYDVLMDRLRLDNSREIKLAKERENVKLTDKPKG